MDFGEIVNLLLYAFSGICFGAFASRYSVFSALHIKSKWQEEGISCLFGCLPQLLFLSVSFFRFSDVVYQQDSYRRLLLLRSTRILFQ